MYGKRFSMSRALNLFNQSEVTHFLRIALAGNVGRKGVTTSAAVRSYTRCGMQIMAYVLLLKSWKKAYAHPPVCGPKHEAAT
jgi:hypothetical protein